MATENPSAGNMRPISYGPYPVVSNERPAPFMVQSATPSYPEIREAVRRLCAGFPGKYWQALDREREYPTAFVRALTEAGFLSVLIPEAYGGSGLGVSAAVAVL